jgi:CBS domain-containing protein
MFLEKITSLADLVFKAKTNKYYKKLAIMTAQWLGYDNQATYEIAMNTLYKVALLQGEKGCLPVVDAVNNLRCEVYEDPEPVAAPIIDESIKKEKEEKLFKKKGVEWGVPPWDEDYESRARQHYEQMERVYWERRYNPWYGSNT